MNAATDGTAGSGTRACHCPCGADRFVFVHEYTEPPAGEVRFRFTAPGAYRRSLLRCEACGHFVSVLHGGDHGSLYEHDYVDATYGPDGIGAAFARITALPDDQSDNAGRVARVVEFAATHFAGRDVTWRRSVLDVGSGLCVFLSRMRERGWDCTALDPDARAVRHARERVGVDAIHGHFLTVPVSRAFDVVTFNKVLEHVPEPASMLSRARLHLASGGFVYVEVPDGARAIADGPEREEFFVDHLHVFSEVSLSLLVERSGFVVERIGALREPSGKYTLCAFLTPAEAQGNHGKDNPSV